MKSSTHGCGQQPKVSKPKKVPRLQVVKLEGRIAPGIWSNHNETLVRESAEGEQPAPDNKEASEPRLRVVKLEERIASGIWENHNETLLRDGVGARPAVLPGRPAGS
jgi:hypothetical protein